MLKKFPDIDIQEHKAENGIRLVSFRTNVRINHNSKYYLVPFIRHYNRKNAYKQFLHDIYQTLTLHIPTEAFHELSGTLVDKLDPNQIDEKQRVRELFGFICHNIR